MAGSAALYQSAQHEQGKAFYNRVLLLQSEPLCLLSLNCFCTRSNLAPVFR